MAKKTIRCKKCENRVLIFETGFSGDSYFVCGLMHRPFDKDDGCTFGIEGPSKFKCIKNPIDIDIASHAAVHGHYICERC